MNFSKRFAAQRSPLSKYLIFKSFLHALTVLGCLKKGLGPAFGVHFQHTFSIKMSFLNTLSIDQVSI